jgi:predicted GIY-YIG superfamily endonuclease
MILLNDHDTYEEINNDPLKDSQRNFNNTMKLILKDHPNLIQKFNAYLPSLPYFYGLPKLHKENIPLRPIISNVNSVTNSLAKWVASILSLSLGKISPSHLKNSSDLLEKIGTLETTNLKLISFDITSLYTNVPINTTIEWLDEYYENNPSPIPIEKDTFFKLVKLCFSHSFFSFNKKFYRQKNGLTMGSPASPVIANLFMELFEKKYLSNVFDERCKFYRYMDDSLAILPQDFDENRALEQLNSFHPDIQFTMELEVNKKLPFLDLLIDISNHRPSFKIYRKPTHIDSYIHWFSSHNFNTKRGIIIGQFLRALRLCSPQYVDEELLYISEVFKKLAYPENIIYSALRTAKKRFYIPHENENEDLKNKNIILIPSLPSKILRDSIPQCISIITKGINKISSEIITNRNSIKYDAGIYKIPCDDCEKCYIGETDNLKRRLYQHSYSLNNADTNSSLHLHRMNENHRINLKLTTLELNINEQRKRQFLENIIINTVNCFNHRRDACDPFTLKILDNLNIRPKLKPPDG